jgi:hypothetical protein
MWEKIKLPANYSQALAIIDDQLAYWPNYLIHKNKQRLTKIHQYLIRMRKLKLKIRSKLVGINRKVEKREVNREKKAEKAARLGDSISAELLARLKAGTYDGSGMYLPEKEYNQVLDIIADENKEKQDIDYNSEEEEELEEEEEEEDEEEEQFEADEFIADYGSDQDIENLNNNLNNKEYEREYEYEYDQEIAASNNPTNSSSSNNLISTRPTGRKQLAAFKLPSFINENINGNNKSNEENNNHHSKVSTKRSSTINSVTKSTAKKAKSSSPATIAYEQ